MPGQGPCAPEPVVRFVPTRPIRGDVPGTAGPPTSVRGGVRSGRAEPVRRAVTRRDLQRKTNVIKARNLARTGEGLSFASGFGGD